ncbi:mitotic-spindle organizing gamma-tubulin ring associated-domain-containing protein [Dendryphion nanum]|uniref:Mitotic-spindle organizing protein 1 n=1 Tax=Dendryphion nanum TaxID=256645 RepID=A0A9P9D955_9PLEO|nr:mitotic-spindle organizing gamma-tubulin ring associated-domain-containing protein [Dendryphion nanum]
MGSDQPAPQPAPSQDVKRKAAREVIDILHEISTLLNTHLDRQQLSYCVSLIENGAHPEALAVRPLVSSSPPHGHYLHEQARALMEATAFHLKKTRAQLIAPHGTENNPAAAC